MPPVLDPSKSKVDGLAFLGLSLTQKSDLGHQNSQTHQTAFDLNKVLDRKYQYLFSTNDDGWLVGGGEPGPPTSYKLPAPDSAHVELLRIGTYEPNWGGVPLKEIIQAMQDGDIWIPPMVVIPTAVVANGDIPPELEIRFDMESPANDQHNSSGNINSNDALPWNWQLRFVHNQLFRRFVYPSRFCPGAFHSTIVRKAEFRSPQHRQEYFANCQNVIDQWKQEGPKPLIPSEPLTSSIAMIPTKQWQTEPETDTHEPSLITSEEKKLPDEEVASNQASATVQNNNQDEYDESLTKAGIYLFTDRNHITHHFPPNFMPPYTGAKLELIQKVLSEEWDEATLSWKPAGKKNDDKEEDTSVTVGELSQAEVVVANHTTVSKDDASTKLVASQSAVTSTSVKIVADDKSEAVTIPKDSTAHPSNQNKNLYSSCGMGVLMDALLLSDTAP